MLDWLIVGGGVHGTFVSHYLTQIGRVTRDRIRVLDPYPRALARWDRWTINTATDFLRSPDEHHMDIAPEALVQFAATDVGRAAGRMTEERRPQLGLFRAHAHVVAERHALEALRVQGTATGLARRPRGDGWQVETSTGPVSARQVVLAIGPDDEPPWPSWARAHRSRGGAIDHVLEAGFSRAAVGANEHVLVIGGGISAAQLVLALVARGSGAVTLLTRHPPRVHTLDADLAWFQRGGSLEFARAIDPRIRRNLLGLGRRRGSMPKETAYRLGLAIQSGQVVLRFGEVARAAMNDGAFRVETAEHALTCDRIVLATGFSPRRPGGAWLTRAIASQGLPIAPCGYPITDPLLAWRPGLHVTGPLAELQLGAAARSINGARRTAEILGNVT